MTEPQNDDGDWRTVAEALAQLQSAYSAYVPVGVSWRTRERIAAALAIAERHINQDGGDGTHIPSHHIAEVDKMVSAAPDALGERAPCEECDGTGNLYRYDQDGDFIISCDACAGTGEQAPTGDGLETTAEERADWQLRGGAGGPDAVRRLIRDIHRLTTLLAEARAERDYHRKAHDSAVVRIAQLTKECAESLASRARAREEEREACAKIADSVADQEEHRSVGNILLYALRLAVLDTAKKIAAVIRARGAA